MPEVDAGISMVEERIIGGRRIRYYRFTACGTRLHTNYTGQYHMRRLVWSCLLLLEICWRASGIVDRFTLLPEMYLDLVRAN